MMITMMPAKAPTNQKAAMSAASHATSETTKTIVIRSSLSSGSVTSSSFSADSARTHESQGHK